jgi:cyclase
MAKPLVVMPCMDMIAGRVVKGVRFVDIRDAGDPVECCKAYCEAGADELAMLDITATIESRKTLLDVTRRVADVATVPFTMGGGVSTVKSAEEILKAGADKFSTSSAAFRNPAMVGEMVTEFGSGAVTVAIDVLQNPAMPSGYEVYIDGGNTATGRDAVEWAKEVDGYGVGCILPTSKSTDGVRTGYDLPLIRKIRAVARPEVDVVASGGAGTMEHFAEAAEAGANVLLAASVFHFHVIDIPSLKRFLGERGFSVKL